MSKVTHYLLDALRKVMQTGPRPDWHSVELSNDGVVIVRNAGGFVVGVMSPETYENLCANGGRDD